MLAWISANLINIALTAAVVLIAALLIRAMLRNRKAGKSACGCSCSSCGGCGGCARCGTAKTGAAAEKPVGVPGGSAR